MLFKSELHRTPSSHSFFNRNINNGYKNNNLDQLEARRERLTSLSSVTMETTDLSLQQHSHHEIENTVGVRVLLYSKMPTLKVIWDTSPTLIRTRLPARL